MPSISVVNAYENILKGKRKILLSTVWVLAYSQ